MALTRPQIGYTLRILQLLLSACVFIIAVLASIRFGYYRPNYVVVWVLAALAVVFASAEACVGLRAISSPRPFKRATLLWWNGSGVLALLISLITMCVANTQPEAYGYTPYVFAGPGAGVAALGLACAVVHFCWVAPARRSSIDGLVRYTALQGWKQDIETQV